MIRVALFWVLFIKSNEDSLEGYRPACFQILGSKKALIRIYFKSNLNFLPQQMEMRFNRYEKSLVGPGKARQHFKYKLNYVDEACTSKFDVGWLKELEKPIRNHTITLVFGKQKHILDQYKFTLYDKTLEGSYYIEGMRDKSMIEIHVLNKRNAWSRYPFDGTFYDQQIPFVGQSSFYCLHLWNRYPGKKFAIQFTKSTTDTLPEFITVSFQIFAPQILAENPSFPSAIIDFGKLELCPNQDVSHDTISIYIQPEIAKGRLEFKMVDPGNKVFSQSVYSLDRTQNPVFIKSESSSFSTSMHVYPVSLQSIQNLNYMKNIAFYEEEVIERTCVLSGKECKINECHQLGIQLYTKAVCEVSIDPMDKLFVRKKISDSDLEKCMASSRMVG